MCVQAIPGAQPLHNNFRMPCVCTAEQFKTLCHGAQHLPFILFISHICVFQRTEKVNTGETPHRSWQNSLIWLRSHHLLSILSHQKLTSITLLSDISHISPSPRNPIFRSRLPDSPIISTMIFLMKVFENKFRVRMVGI